jgi:hypothetical protein
MSSDNTSTKFAIYTDDSGVVISQAQYAELHGGLIESDRRTGVSLSGNSSKKKRKGRYYSSAPIQYPTNYVVNIKTNKEQKPLLVDAREKCPFCHYVMPRELLVDHIHEKHPSIDLRTVGIVRMSTHKYRPVYCPLCDHVVQYKMLFAHIEETHPEQQAKLIMAEFNRKYRKQQEDEKIERDLDHLVSEYERLKQSHDEPRDAGKYMGFMSRENGKFGSLPLHDNYSDESDAA